MSSEDIPEASSFHVQGLRAVRRHHAWEIKQEVKVSQKDAFYLKDILEGMQL